MSEIPFQFRNGLLYLPVTLIANGNTLTMDNCIFDTGSAGTVFDTDIVAKIGIQSTPNSKLKRLMTVGGGQTVFISCVDELKLNDEILLNAEIEVGNLHSKFGIEGIIGTDLIQKLDWEIRFSDRKIRLIKAT